MSRHLIWPVCLLLAMSACAQREIFDLVPDTGQSVQRNATWPVLVSSSQFENRGRDNSKANEDAVQKADALSGRVSRLRRRAASLRGPILSNGERSKLRTSLMVQ